MMRTHTKSSIDDVTAAFEGGKKRGFLYVYTEGINSSSPSVVMATCLAFLMEIPVQ